LSLRLFFNFRFFLFSKTRRRNRDGVSASGVVVLWRVVPSKKPMTTRQGQEKPQSINSKKNEGGIPFYLPAALAVLKKLNLKTCTAAPQISILSASQRCFCTLVSQIAGGSWAHFYFRSIKIMKSFGGDRISPSDQRNRGREHWRDRPGFFQNSSFPVRGGLEKWNALSLQSSTAI